MNLGDLAFRLIIILFPGIISTMLYRKLVIKKKWESIDIGLNALLFGIITYLLLQLVYLTLDKGELIIWQRLQDNQSVPYIEIFYASIISVLVSIFSSLIINKQYINRTANYLQVTTKYGENNLFYNFLSSNDITEVHVKDPINNLIYTGYLKYFSEDDEVREIVLEDVDLYEYDNAKHMNKLKTVYLNRAKTDNLIIEVPNLITNKSKEDGEAKK